MEPLIVLHILKFSNTWNILFDMSCKLSTDNLTSSPPNSGIVDGLIMTSSARLSSSSSFDSSSWLSWSRDSEDSSVKEDRSEFVSESESGKQPKYLESHHVCKALITESQQETFNLTKIYPIFLINLGFEVFHIFLLLIAKWNQGGEEKDFRL